MQALLFAVRNYLRTGGGGPYANAECDVRPDGAPGPIGPQVFVAVSPGGIRNSDTSPHSLDEEYEIKVTLTMKSGWLPVDNYGPEMVAKASTGLYARAEALRARIHGNYTIINNANTTIGAGENGFIEPLKFSYMTPPQFKGPDWFSGEDLATPPSGLAVDLTFVAARRVQVIEEQS